MAIMTAPGAAVTAAAPDSGAGKGLPLSPFHVAAVAFQRARQLQAGARPRVESTSRSPTRLSVLEVLADTVSWTVLERPPLADGSPK